MNAKMTTEQIQALQDGDRMGSVILGCTSYTRRDVGPREQIGSIYQSAKWGACTVIAVEAVGAVSDIDDHDQIGEIKVYCRVPDDGRRNQMVAAQKKNAAKFASAE